MNNEAKCDKFTAINELARRRGFFWQSYEIYGGVGGLFCLCHLLWVLVGRKQH